MMCNGNEVEIFQGVDFQGVDQPRVCRCGRTLGADSLHGVDRARFPRQPLRAVGAGIPTWIFDVRLTEVRPVEPLPFRNQSVDKSAFAIDIFAPPGFRLSAPEVCG